VFVQKVEEEHELEYHKKTLSVQQTAIVIDSDDENEPPTLQINPPKKLKNDDVIVID
jgi:hypothetical protein